uniref:Uncharacterized protein n=1 Tax=Anguilla anguilla TaxID=7936 RepID=A0A0E9SN33_ANGAN
MQNFVQRGEHPHFLTQRRSPYIHEKKCEMLKTQNGQFLPVSVCMCIVHLKIHPGAWLAPVAKFVLLTLAMSKTVLCMNMVCTKRWRG